jgi:Kef-type K+ transport system membrane component KefB
VCGSALQVGTLCLFAYITSLTNPPHGFIGSHLLGAFVAGMCFVNVPRSHAIWQTQFKRIGRWTVRFFFAASVGFAVPVSDMTDPKVIWKGVLLGIGPCISTKIFSGAFAYMRYATPKARERARQASWATRFAQPQQMLVGMAMVARGEFAYMVAETAVCALTQRHAALAVAAARALSPRRSRPLTPPLAPSLTRRRLRCCSLSTRRSTPKGFRGSA